jgi:hypothetical protein
LPTIHPGDVRIVEGIRLMFRRRTFGQHCCFQCARFSSLPFFICLFNNSLPTGSRPFPSCLGGDLGWWPLQSWLIIRSWGIFYRSGQSAPPQATTRRPKNVNPAKHYGRCSRLRDGVHQPRCMQVFLSRSHWLILSKVVRIAGKSA